MSWRDLPPIPDDRWELQRPIVDDSSPEFAIILKFSDQLSRQWWLHWLRSKDCYEEFSAWIDIRR